MKADRNLFGVISQSRYLDIKEALLHPLGTIPLSLASSGGTLRKTKKAVSSNNLEQLSSPAEDIPNNSECIKGNHKTFKEIAEALFGRIMAESV